MQQHDEKLRAVSAWFGREATTFQNSRVFQQCGTRLVELATLQGGERVLDIGTGTGAVLFPAAEAAGTTGHVTGIDLAEPMAAATRAEALRRGVRNVELLEMNAEHLMFPDASFDAVVSGFVLMLIPDLARALEEVARVLQPAGRFAASLWAPTPSEITPRIRELRSEFPDSPTFPSSQTLSSPDLLAERLRESGFRVVHAAAESITTVYADEEDYWSERGSQGNDNLPPELMARFKARVFEMLRAARNADGRIEETRTPIYAVATPGRRPA